MKSNENQPVTPGKQNPASSSAVADDGKALEKKEAVSDSVNSPRQMECEELVIDLIRSRRTIGRVKYGVTMEREDLMVCDWLLHAQEEALDLVIYLERLKRSFKDVPQSFMDGMADCNELANERTSVSTVGSDHGVRVSSQNLPSEHVLQMERELLCVEIAQEPCIYGADCEDNCVDPSCFPCRARKLASPVSSVERDKKDLGEQQTSGIPGAV